MIAFSASEMTRDLRSGPAMTRSSASLNSGMLMVLRLRRAARMAASLTRFARSAPEKPGDLRAMVGKSIVLSSGLPLLWTSRIVQPALHVRAVEDDLAVETAGPQERRVEHVGAVGGRDDDDVRVRVEAVHLDEDLVEGLLALVVASRRGRRRAGVRPRRSRRRRRCRGVALGLVEQVADAAGTDADEHLDELRAGDREERHAGLAGDRASEQRLAGAGRPDEQHAARDTRAEGVELLGVLQELHDLLELHLRLVHACDIGEGDDGLVAEEHPGAALAERQRLVVAALGLAEHEEQEQADEQDREQARQEERQEAAIAGRIVRREVRHAGTDGGRIAAHRQVHVLLDIRDELARDLADADVGLAGGRRLVEGDLQAIASLGDSLHLALLDEGEEGAIPGVADLVGRGGLEEEHVQQRGGAHDEHHRDDAVSQGTAVQGAEASGTLGVACR